MRIRHLTALAFALLCLFPAAALADLGWAVCCGQVALYQPMDGQQTQTTWIDDGTWVYIQNQVEDMYSVVTEDERVSGYVSTNVVYQSNDGLSMAMNGTLLLPSVHTSAEIGVVTNPEGTAFLNLRATPSYTAKVLGYYYNGVPCIITDRSVYGWYGVTVDGVSGYFRAEFVATATKPLRYSPMVATVTTPDNTALNLRSGPSMRYGIIKQYHGGDYVMVLQQGRNWWMVAAADGRVGFMSADYLKSGVYTPTGQNSVLVDAAPDDHPAALPYAVVNNPKVTQVLNLREMPDTRSRVLGQFTQGARFTVLAQGMEWCRVMSQNGLEGFMMTDYLKLYNLPDVPTRRVNHPQHTYVNLRSEASQSFGDGNVLAAVPHGAVVTVMIPGEVWMKVRYNGNTGWMMACFLE